MYDESNAHCSFFLRSAGLDRLDLLEIISHGLPEDFFDESADSDSDDERGDGIAESMENAPDTDDDEKPAAGNESRRSKKAALAQFTVELTARAEKGQLEPLVGRDDIVERTVQVLCRRLKNNPPFSLFFPKPPMYRPVWHRGLYTRL